MVRRIAVSVVLLLSGCGESAEERICGAANGCGALATANVGECVERLETIDAERALTECAECLEAKTCAEIGAGACAPNCSPFATVFETGPMIDRNKRLSDVTSDEATTLCTYSLDQVGGPNQTEMCSSELTVSSGTQAQCTSYLLGVTCTVTVGQYLDCFDAVDSPCDSLTAPACQPLAGC